MLQSRFKSSGGTSTAHTKHKAKLRRSIAQGKGTPAGSFACQTACTPSRTSLQGRNATRGRASIFDASRRQPDQYRTVVGPSIAQAQRDNFLRTLAAESRAPSGHGPWSRASLRRGPAAALRRPGEGGGRARRGARAAPGARASVDQRAVIAAKLANLRDGQKADLGPRIGADERDACGK
jgi:hypothetical protein